MERNHDQPAFPCDVKDFEPNTGTEVTRQQFFGLTKRELMATLICAGVLASAASGIRPNSGVTQENIYDKIPEVSVLLADKLLEHLDYR